MNKKDSTEMLYEVIEEREDKLNEWEESFVFDMQEQIERKLMPLTEKQEAKIKEIHDRYFS